MEKIIQTREVIQHNFAEEFINSNYISIPILIPNDFKFKLKNAQQIFLVMFAAFIVHDISC